MVDKKKQIIKLLWVEDETEGGMVERKSFLETSDYCDLVIERNATDAENAIVSKSFDKVIFDIRIPPGYGEYWEQLYLNRNYRLGINLLQRTYEILLKKNTSIGIYSIERWIDIEEAILSIDPKFDSKKQYSNKNDSFLPEDFSDFIQNL